MDKIDGLDQATARAELKKHNPRASFPTLVIDDGKIVIIGHKNEEIRGVFSWTNNRYTSKWKKTPKKTATISAPTKNSSKILSKD